jgi:hypothetical protein
MSCEKNAAKVAAQAALAGVPRLANERAFYAGLVASAAGLLAGGLLLARRAGRGRRPRSRPTPTERESPTLAAQNRIQPSDPSALSGNCPSCNASPQGKPGTWYVIGDRPYCQDCAPEAARQAGVKLAVAAPTPRSRSPDRSYLVGMRQPSIEERDASDFSPAKCVPLTRTQGRVRVRVVTEDDPVGQWHFHQKAYLLLDEDGQETGLAVTPGVDVLRDSDGDPVRHERDRYALRSTDYDWHVSHVGSGTALAGPYRSVDQAHALAEILAQLDWKREKLTTFSREDRFRIWRTLANYEPGLGAYRLELRQAGIRPPDKTWGRAGGR